MASSSYANFGMKNLALFQALETIGVKFNKGGSECRLLSGEVYKFCFSDGESVPYLGFNHDFMIGIYLEYFLGCGNRKFSYQFMKILTENGYFNSDYNFEANPFDENGYYGIEFYQHFQMTAKLTDFDSTIENAFVESVEYDGEVTAFRASVVDGVMTICDLQFEVALDDFDDLYEFWNAMDPDEMDEFAIRKIMQDGYWVEQ